MDIRPAEGIDGLFGVADQNQGGGGVVAGHPVDGIEDTVLHRVRVLELVDEGDGKLATDGIGQARAIRPLQGGVEPGQELIEAHLGAARLLGGEAFRHPAGGVTQDCLPGIGQTAQGGAQVGGGRQGGVAGRRLAFRLPGIADALRGEPVPAGLEVQGLGGRVVHPGA